MGGEIGSFIINTLKSHFPLKNDFHNFLCIARKVFNSTEL